MDSITIDFNHIVNLTKNLTPVEKVKLIKYLSSDIENTLQSQKSEKHSLKGLFKGCSISSEDIGEIRKEMWENFPRNDF